MMQLLYLLVVGGAAIFWLVEVVDLLFRDVHFFENHTHKLVWFLVLVAGNIVGAIWYSLWKQAVVTAWAQSHKQ